VNFWLKLSRSRHLEIVRDSLTLAFPVIIAGALAVLINNFPVSSYQMFMDAHFGDEWKSFGGYVWDGTLAVLAPVMVCTIAYGICELHNSNRKLNTVHPLIVALISLCSLMAIIEPSSGAIPYTWIGIHGLFLAIIVAIVSSELFLWLWRKNFKGRFFTEASSSAMNSAFSSLLPGTVTIFVFAAFKALMSYLGFSDIHRLTYDLLCRPFVGMGNNLLSAVVFGVARQALWFLGIHGSNALEPVMTELYSSSAAAAAGTGQFAFTKAFFDSYATLGGAGNTLSLIFALLIARRGRRLGTVTKLSILPAIFNINETLLFGVPIVLNPVFLIPFMLTPSVLTVTGYAAISSGLVSVTNAEVAWTTPALLSGYVASGDMSGVFLQIFNLALGTAIYLPFVKASDRAQADRFSGTFKELIELSYTLGEDGGAALILRNDGIGALSRSLASDLMYSAKNGELYLEYQPQIDCQSGRAYGVEALLRWRHPSLGRIPPSLFIPLAEEVGCIDEIGLWVCGESCRQIREWNDAGITGVIMSFNVSVKQLDDPDLPEKVAAIMSKWRVDPSSMKAEVTESTGLSSNMGHNVILQDLRLTGLNLAIDDFGMGHTSLVYLKEFPVSMIKLDGSLVRDIAISNVSREIIGTISELCKSMDIKLLAEFVENEEQALMLKSLGCHIFQGYLYSPALGPSECAEAIKRGFKQY
jgi:lactose/cellobiose-specific phosphotransferase system IIC component